MANSSASIQQLYIAYFNRPADPLGLAYWVNSSLSVKQIAESFAQQQEYKDTYAGLTNAQLINSIYNNLFGHNADVPGLNYWAGQLTSGAVTPGAAALSILNGALGADKTAVDNKTLAAGSFTTAVDTTPEIVAYSGAAANSTARGWLAGVVDATTLAAAQATQDATIATIVTGQKVGQTFTIVPETNASILHITGDQTVRIDFTSPTSQIKGLDLNGNGIIDANGVENNSPAVKGELNGYTIVDAYARNPLNATDSVNNFRGDISFDGTGFGGDGVKTNGNIYLGGTGVDVALGGTGNDFLVGGGVASGRFVTEVNAAGSSVIRDTLYNKIVPSAPGDFLSGGRNADFFFGEFSRLDATDGNNSTYDGGNTTDDSAAGRSVATSGVNSQNNDWFLIEASDDDEPVAVNLASGFIQTRAGANAALIDIESVDASGNFYNNLDGLNVKLGGRATQANPFSVAGDKTNFGIGSSAQLNITGSDAANVIVGGYDNDRIDGGNGNDILFGGSLQFLENHLNNANLLDAKGGLNLNITKVGTVNDGIDTLLGGAGNDAIVFELDGGVVDGGADTGTTSGANAKATGDTVYLTDYSVGRLVGATLAGEATAQNDALVKLTTDSVVRFDLGNSGTANFKNYGGSNAATQDATNYATGAAAVTVTGVESVIATGLGAIDFRPTGTNTPELLKAGAQQNFGAIDANLVLLGSGADNTLYANTGSDIVEGRGGDDNLSGGIGNDRFVFALGDGVDLVQRQTDANKDSIQDVSATGAALFGQDFRAPQIGDITSSNLTIDFGTTDLTSVNVAVTSFNLKIGGVAFSVADTAALAAAKSAAALASVVNTAYKAIDPTVTVTAVGNTIAVNDKAGRVISDTVASGYGVGVVLGSGSASTTPTFLAGGTPTNLVENDILIFKDYADRSANVGRDAARSEVNQATSLVTNFGATGTQLASSQQTLIRVTDAVQGDVVTVTVNGNSYSYTTKVGENSTQVVAGLVAAINGDLDGNSAAGRLVATVAEVDPTNFPSVPSGALNGAQFALTQAVVGGSQTYFNVVTSVTNTLTNKSAVVATHDQSGNNINLLGFDGTNGNLNASDVLFQGLSATASYSILQTAKNAGETITGSDANAVTGSAGAKWINGDDLLIGGAGNDTINAGTGDDRILVSKGNDTVDGGGRGSSPTNFTDTLQAEEGTFGTGTHFTVALGSVLGVNGTGTLTALDAANAALGTTTFSGIEVVRVLENNRTSTVDLTALSNSVATAVGSNALASEGLTVNLLNGNGTIRYTVDVNNNGSIADDVDFNAFATTSVFGAENVTTGAANDTVNLDETQASANNQISLGGQQDNAVTFVEGKDTVNYQDARAVASQPAVTLTVESAAGVDTVAFGGAVPTTDTLTNVEQINFNSNSANGAAFADTLDLSKLAGATVNFGTAETVNKSLGGGNTVTSATTLDSNSLAQGGVAVTGAGLGTEVAQIGNIERFENVIGSAGSDRVILADNYVNTLGTPADTLSNTLGVHSAYYQYNSTTVEPTFFNIGLYNFDLDAGNDVLDYKQESTDVVVIVDTSATSTVTTSVDYIVAGTLRVDVASNVERYFGGGGNSYIDLGNATVDTTIQYSKESATNLVPNEYAEPNGNDTVTTSGLTRGTEVRSTVGGTVFATFEERVAGNPAGTAYWQNVYGGSQSETVALTDDQTGLTYSFQLGAGKNVVDYSALTTTVTANIGVTNTASADRTQNINVNGHIVNQFHSASDANASYATIVGSARAGDVADVTALTLTRTVAGSGNTNTTATLNQVDVRYHTVDLSTGVITEDTNGLYGTLAAQLNAGFVTRVTSFESATNAGDNDIVHLIGSSGANTLIGGNGADEITGGNGTGTAAGGGDTLTGGAGADSFIYTSETQSPGGAVGVEQLASVFPNAAAIANSQDTITDFAAGTDNLVFNISDSYNAVRVTGAIPANLAGNLNALGTAGLTFAAGQTNVNLDIIATGATPGQQANFQILNTGATLTVADVVLNVTGSSAGDIIDASAGLSVTALNAASTDGLQVNVVYTAASQSQGGGYDSIIHFTSGEDKIDLSFLKLPETAVLFGAQFDTNGVVGGPGDGIADAIQGLRNLPSSPLVAFNADATGLFIDATGQYRAIAIQSTSDGNGDPSVTVFVDTNHDGNYSQGTDMVISLVGVPTVLITDFIFDHY